MKRINRLITCILLLSFIYILPGTSTYAEQPIRVLIEGAGVKFVVDPIMVEGTTLVPLRNIFEALDFTVSWEESTKRIIGKSESFTIKLQIGSVEAIVNDKSYRLPLALRLVGQHSFVPVRFVSEATGREVTWDQDTRTVSIGAEPEPYRYEGEMSDGLRNGMGKLFEYGQLLYEGQFSNDLPEGQGKQYYEDGTLKYEGSFQEGLMHGDGKLYRADGTLWYEAVFDRESINGWGIIYFPLGHRLEVEFLDGLPHGEGEYYYSDNTLRFVGEYRNGLKNGFGVGYYANGNMMNEGEYINSELIQGKLYYETGELWYEGEFLNFLPHGQGIEYNSDGSLIHQGEFRNGKPTT